MRRLFEAAVIIIGTLGWWGFVYPELCLTREAYAEYGIVQDKKAAYAKIKDGITGEPEKICIKSKLLEYILSEDMTE